MSICITTGFKNLGRDNWDDFARSTDNYFEGFAKLCRKSPYPIIAYLEKEEWARVKSVPPWVKILHMEPLDLLVYSHNERDWEILNSREYEILLKNAWMGTEHPERSKKGYNMINASKINMVANTKRRCPGFEWYAWQDFGLANLEGGEPIEIDTSKLRKDRITVQGRLYDPTKTPCIDPVGLARTDSAFYICGATFIVPEKLVDTFDKWMREKVEEYHEINLTDDDQSLMVSIMYDNPRMFEWVDCGIGWFDLWKNLRVKY